MLKNFFLRVEFLDLVMQQWIFFALLEAGRAADHDDRRFFGVSFRGGVGDLQPADTVSDADRAEPFDAGVGIGGKPGALLIAGIDDPQFAFGKLIVKAEHIIAGNTEYMPDAVRIELLD